MPRWISNSLLVSGSLVAAVLLPSKAFVVMPDISPAGSISNDANGVTWAQVSSFKLVGVSARVNLTGDLDEVTGVWKQIIDTGSMPQAAIERYGLDSWGNTIAIIIQILE